MCMKLCVMLWNDIWLIVSENMVQMNIFGSVREEITGDWRKLYIEECYDLYSSPAVVQVIIQEDEMDEMWHAWDGSYLHTGCWL